MKKYIFFSKKKHLVWSILAVLFVAYAIRHIVIVSHPLWKNPQEIREDVLKELPIGMSMDDCIRYIEDRKEWGLMRVEHDFGYIVIHGTVSFRVEGYENDERVVGKKMIQIHLGDY